MQDTQLQGAAVTHTQPETSLYGWVGGWGGVGWGGVGMAVGVGWVGRSGRGGEVCGCVWVGVGRWVWVGWVGVWGWVG